MLLEKIPFSSLFGPISLDGSKVYRKVVKLVSDVFDGLWFIRRGPTTPAGLNAVNLPAAIVISSLPMLVEMTPGLIKFTLAPRQPHALISACKCSTLPRLDNP